MRAGDAGNSAVWFGLNSGGLGAGQCLEAAGRSDTFPWDLPQIIAGSEAGSGVNLAEG